MQVIPGGLRKWATEPDLGEAAEGQNLLRATTDMRKWRGLIAYVTADKKKERSTIYIYHSVTDIKIVFYVFVLDIVIFLHFGIIWR